MANSEMPLELRNSPTSGPYANLSLIGTLAPRFASALRTAFDRVAIGDHLRVNQPDFSWSPFAEPVDAKNPKPEDIGVVVSIKHRISGRVLAELWVDNGAMVSFAFGSPRSTPRNSAFIYHGDDWNAVTPFEVRLAMDANLRSFPFDIVAGALFGALTYDAFRLKPDGMDAAVIPVAPHRAGWIG